MTLTDDDILPADVREGLRRARGRARRASGGRLRVQVGESWYPIRSYDEAGFEVALDVAPKLRGLVEIHEGPTLLRTALVVAGEPRGDAMRYEFKRVTRALSAPPVDYVRADDAPAGLIADR